MNIDLKYTLKKTVELLAIPSPVGYTHMAIEWVRKELESLGVKKYNITKKGALIAYVKGKDSNYKKMISAHVDTLGAVVKKVKKNGRLEITNAGGFAWGSVEGENVTIHTLSEKTYTGTILPVKASVHVYGDVAREMPRTEETMEIRIDEDVKTDQDVFKLGILQGDFVSLDPRTRVLENGYIHKIQGKGSIVLDVHRYRLPVTGILSFKERHQFQDLEAKTKVIINEEIEAPDFLVKLGVVQPGEKLTYLLRQRIVNGEAVIFGKGYIIKK